MRCTRVDLGRASWRQSRLAWSPVALVELADGRRVSAAYDDRKLSFAVLRRMSLSLAWVCAVVMLFAVPGCGGSSPAPDQSSSPAMTPRPSDESAVSRYVGGVSVRSVERALLAHGGPPTPTLAACRASSAAERASAPFGPTRRPLFTCQITLLGERASYAVQVLHNGCFVAERRRRGQAVYGCGADRS
jgi:hypothetical protein